ncbi:MAG: TetR/AcrR family transcriptional regulator [Desulfobacterales bacterium]|nr:TetR/AcrR family transcriptional regulator [Desulfobacterales bacterium]MDD4073600.1 TetR/AcrR family transcriptional regulator [Desulfobacterales bacterium]MDD4393452.1 TetR/AcrR family transcriptional regulator [Desulfobacterales bacterium]
MKKIELKKKLKLNSIVKAAQELFQANGFIGTSMDKIADKAGVTKQTVYRYFDSKEALFKAALDLHRLDATSHDFIEALNLEDATNALETFATGFIERHLSKEHLANIRLLVSEGPMVPEITRVFYARGPRRMRTRLSQFLKDRFNIDDAEYEIGVFLDILLSLRMPVLTGLHAPPSRESLRRHAAKAVKVLMKLLDL